ncbi:hypothetical protein RLOC_00013114 [Lonchura striata]|uniref:Uncharacterized protein n=1 Tax=Lonchura striata TaxID=40157 RepID=A0A218UDB0_9PASE|nr:hypothetical protein RLOC_00013114 [Lonchura striata domestica]
MREDVDFIPAAWLGRNPDHPKPILNTSSGFSPYRLALTEALYLKDDDWHFITVDTRDPGTWRNIRTEDVRTTISKMQDMIHHLKKESAGWLDSLLEGWGLSGWIKSVMQTGLMLLLGLVALVIGFGVIKRLLMKAINTTVSINHAMLTEPHELKPLNDEEPKEENPSDGESVWFEDETMNCNSPV